MKTIIKIVAVITLSITLNSCKKCTTYGCQAGDPNITGAYCQDGTQSNATGSGACSGHGGVSQWRCESCE